MSLADESIDLLSQQAMAMLSRIDAKVNGQFARRAAFADNEKLFSVEEMTQVNAELKQKLKMTLKSFQISHTHEKLNKLRASGNLVASDFRLTGEVNQDLAPFELDAKLQIVNRLEAELKKLTSLNEQMVESRKQELSSLSRRLKQSQQIQEGGLNTRDIAQDERVLSLFN